MSGSIYQWALAAAVCVVLSTTVAAQTPQRTSATYEDWTVRCVTGQGQGPGQGAGKSCEMVQAVHIQGQSNPITQLAIGRAKKGEPLKLVAQVPINVWLPAGVKLVFDSKKPPLVTSYKRCLPAACLADIELKDEQIKTLRAATEQGRLEFEDGAQRAVAMPVSFKGFGEAFDAMEKQ